ncbi:hypothetical protein F5878DRAFT_664937 [Lentinula raphanica]|uniref:RING-type domain-containing protein n=1 Tax=Lentinula raphanica TaxID=153919 RepID=A0AA38U9K9_9AGAR|nr:hypothetical protein F5878DRAFT_664937 [Lentinula raphanica]
MGSRKTASTPRHSKIKVARCRVVPASHGMVLRKRTGLVDQFASSSPSSGTSLPPHSRPTSPSLNETYAFGEALTPTSSVPSSITPDDVATRFQLEIDQYKALADAVIAEQAEALRLLKDQEALLQKKYQSTMKKFEEDLADRKRDYQCPLCLDLAWDSHVLGCGHSFCSKCLNEHKAKHEQKRRDNPQTAEILIRCPTCHSYILSKPLRSATIQAGVKRVAAELFMQVPPTQSLQWVI